MEQALLIILGAAIGAVPTFFMAKMNNKAARERQEVQIVAEQEKHLKSLALQMALTEYRAHFDQMLQVGGTANPPTSYIAGSYLGLNKFMRTDLNHESIESACKELADFARKSDELWDKYVPRKTE